MEFPEHLDDEDMTLAIKEWTLTGCDIYAGKDPKRGISYVDVKDPDEDRDQPDALGAYVQRGDGFWILVPHRKYPQWDEALAFAEAHDVGS